MTHILFVCLGGFLGSISRFIISSQFKLQFIGTFTVNLLGTICIAFAYLFYDHDIISYHSWLFIGVGFCGSFTTFSTFSYESIELILMKQYKVAMIYISFTLLFSMFFFITILMIFK